MTGDVRDGQRNQQRGRHRPDSRCQRPQPQRAVSADVEHPAALGGTRNAANKNAPTASTAAISPTARTNGRPSVVAGPGLGKPVAASAFARDNVPIRPPCNPQAPPLRPTVARSARQACQRGGQPSCPRVWSCARATELDSPPCPGSAPDGPGTRERGTDYARFSRRSRNLAGCCAIPHGRRSDAR